MRHIDHDAVEGQRVRGMAYQRLVLSMVEMNRDGYAASAGCIGRCSDEQAISEGYRPWEELNNYRGLCRFSGLYHARYLFGIVCDCCKDAVLSLLSGLEDLKVTILRLPAR
jgi:hypothetical protein